MTTALPSLLISRSVDLRALMSSIAWRFSNARRMSMTLAPCFSRAMASMALFAARNSRYDGTTFMAKSAMATMTASTAISAIRPRPLCLPPIQPPSFLAERSEAAELVQVQPDEEGLADDVFVWDESPDAAVARIVPVVTHQEVLARGHGARKTVHIVCAIAGGRPCRQHRRGRVVFEEYFMIDAAERLDIATGKLHALARQIVVDLAHGHRLAVDEQALVAVFEAIAGQADHALDVIERRILGIAEHHDVTARGLAE